MFFGLTPDEVIVTVLVWTTSVGAADDLLQAARPASTASTARRRPARRIFMDVISAQDGSVRRERGAGGIVQAMFTWFGLSTEHQNHVGPPTSQDGLASPPQATGRDAYDTATCSVEAKTVPQACAASLAAPDAGVLPAA